MWWAFLREIVSLVLLLFICDLRSRDSVYGWILVGIGAFSLSFISCSVYRVDLYYGEGCFPRLGLIVTRRIHRVSVEWCGCAGVCVGT